MTWGPAVDVSRAGIDAPVYVQPSVAITGTTVHVVYVTGSPSGAWDIILATSSDRGGTWQYRKVNDEPDTCATHTMPVVASDPSGNRVHLLWLENRFGPGAAVYSSCRSIRPSRVPQTKAVSDHPFVLSTSRDVTIWSGDYAGLVVRERWHAVGCVE